MRLTCVSSWKTLSAQASNAGAKNDARKSELFTFPRASKFSPNSLKWQASNAIILIWNGHTQEFTHTLKVRPTFSLKCLRKCNLRCPSKSHATTVIVIVFWIIIIIFRLYYQEPWSQTRGIWSDAWWEVYHCLFGAELLVSFCLKLKHVSAKN